MVSAIDPSKPIVGNPTTASVRDNFAAAKAEIETLQAQVANIISSMTTQAWITEELPSNTDQPAPQPLTWQTRQLNTILDSGGFLASLVDGAFSLPPGTYAISATFQVMATDRTNMRLRNVSTNTTLGFGINHFENSSSPSGQSIQLDLLVVLPAAATLEFQQFYQNANATWGWGLASGFQPERYGSVTIRKLPQL